MSQQYKIRRASHKGAPVFLGLDDDGHERYSADPERILLWMADGYRARFNQNRAQRSKYVWVDNPDHGLDADRTKIPLAYADGQNVLVPIGLRYVDGEPVGGECEQWLTKSACRTAHPYLAGLPDRLLHHADRSEPTEWFAAVKRRQTLRAKGRRPGTMPSFHRKGAESRFCLFFDGGRGYTLTQTARRSGALSIGGMNPVGHRAHGTRWTITLGLHWPRGVEDHTSVQVNLRTRMVTVVADVPRRVAPFTGRSVGLDRGITHAVACSDGQLLDVPTTIAGHLQTARRRTRAMGRYRKNHPADYWTRPTYIEHKRLAALHFEKAANIRRDWSNKTSARLVALFDLIVLEDLRIAQMTRRPTPNPDPDNPGQFLRNGARAKAGLHRGILTSCWGQLDSMCTYKAAAAGKNVLHVPAAYTSQTCHACGHRDSTSRENQATFCCTHCGHGDNADHNAACNIDDAGAALALTLWGLVVTPAHTGVDDPGGRHSALDCRTRTPLVSSHDQTAHQPTVTTTA